METDKRYFVEGLFILVLSLAAALAFVWLADRGRRDDVLYRIRFAESVSGLSPGEPVKFRGVDVGTVKTMALDPADPQTVQVDVKLRRDTPVKTDTRASLKLKGITGTLFVELEGGAPAAQPLLAATAAGRIPEIPSQKSNLATVLDQLPQVIERFAALESQTRKVLSDVGQTTQQIKQDPSQLVWGPKKKKP